MDHTPIFDVMFSRDDSDTSILCKGVVFVDDHGVYQVNGKSFTLLARRVDGGWMPEEDFALSDLDRGIFTSFTIDFVDFQFGGGLSLLS